MQQYMKEWYPDKGGNWTNWWTLQQQQQLGKTQLSYLAS